MEKRYRVLRFIANVYKILGFIVGILTLLIALFACVGGLAGSQFANQFDRTNALPPGLGALGALAAGLIVLLVGILYTLLLYGAGEGIYLLIALEENTRATTTLLTRQLAALPAPAPVATALPSSDKPTAQLPA